MGIRFTQISKSKGMVGSQHQHGGYETLMIVVKVTSTKVWPGNPLGFQNPNSSKHDLMNLP